VKYLKTFSIDEEYLYNSNTEEVQNKVVGNILVTKKKMGTGIYQYIAYSRVYTKDYQDKYQTIRTFSGHVYGRIGSEKNNKEFGKAYRFICLYFPEAKEGTFSFGTISTYDKDLY
jgi:hypothetical protein